MKKIKDYTSLFSLCYQASKKVFPNHLTRNLLMVYMATFITHILTLRCISFLGFSFQINYSIFIGITCLNGLFVLQSAFFLIIGKQFYLSAQLKLFRYTLMDHGINFIVRQVINPTYFSSNIGILFLTFTIFVNFIMVACISYENYQEKTLTNFNFSFNFYLFIFSFLLQIIDHTQVHSLKSIILCYLLYSLYNSKQNLDKICIQKYEKACISILVNFTLIVTIYLLFQHIISKNMNSYLYYLILLCAYLFVGIFFHQRKQKMLKIKDFQSIKDEQAFLCKIQAICFDIDDVIEGRKIFRNTELNAYLSRHDSICKLPNCPLFAEESKNQLREPHQRKNIKNAVKKLKKHLQLHFEQRYIMNGQDNTISFGFLKFLIIYSKHKRKALEIYNTLSKDDFSIGKSYELYRLKVMIEELQDEESLISMKSTNILFQTYHELSSNIIESFQKICGILLQEKMDVNLLTSFTHQLSNQRRYLDRFIQSLYGIQTFGAYKILTLYKQCCKQLYHEQEKAQFIQKHLQNLLERLDHKKQVQFLSNRSQVGLIAISLSQNSLGNIFSINQYAQAVFGFDGKNIIGKSVNNIMPTTFASYHDSLLMVFLKNRNKKVNGDERVLIGKNKSGLIFPVMLRLQRVIASSDELVFVANIRKFKTKESPIMFIATPEGQVVDYSAGFQFYFMKNNRIPKFNISEVSSNFGDISQDNLTNFDISCQYKPGTVVTVDFKVTSLVFFGNLQAYYLSGTKTSSNSTSSRQILPITSIFSQLIEQARLNCHYNNFVSESSRYFYTMQPKTNTIDPRTSKNRQLTIPFIHMNYFSQLVQTKLQQNKSFSNGIKTIRLVKRHFQPVQQGSQFSSQQYATQQKNVFSNNKNIVSINQLEKSNSSLNNTEKVLLIITLFMVFVNIFSFLVINNAISNKNNTRDIEIAQYQIKQYIADFILFSNFKRLTYNQEIFVWQFNTIKTRIINALQAVQLVEQYKERYFRIIYSEHTWKTIGVLFSRPLVLPDVSQAHLNLQYLNISLTIVFVIVLIFYICLFKQQIFIIYSYFLCLEEPLILTVISKCEKLNKLTFGIQDNISPEVVQGNKGLAAITDENQPTFIKKIKYFNTSSRKHDIVYLPQTFLFVIVIGVLIGVIIAQSKKMSAKFDNINAIASKLSLIGSQSSQLILGSFLSQTSKNITLFSNFSSQFQIFENQIIKYLKSDKNTTTEDIFNTFISGNICNSSYFSKINTSNCLNVASNISTNGLFSVLDFIHTSILQINGKNIQTQSLQTLSTLTLLQYQVIERAIQIMEDILKDIQTDLQYSLRSLYYTFSLIIMAVLIIQYIFLKAVPFKNMQNQIQLVFHIIELFQSMKKMREKSLVSK